MQRVLADHDLLLRVYVGLDQAVLVEWRVFFLLSGLDVDALARYALDRELELAFAWYWWLSDRGHVPGVDAS